MNVDFAIKLAFVYKLCGATKFLGPTPFLTFVDVFDTKNFSVLNYVKRLCRMQMTNNQLNHSNFKRKKKSNIFLIFCHFIWPHSYRPKWLLNVFPYNMIFCTDFFTGKKCFNWMVLEIIQAAHTNMIPRNYISKTKFP